MSLETLQIRTGLPFDDPRLIPLINEAFAVETFTTGPRTDPQRLAASMQKATILFAEMQIRWVQGRRKDL